MEIGDRHPDIAVDPVGARGRPRHPDCRDVWCRLHLERAARPLDEAPPDALAAPPTERKAYAVDPPGRPTPPADPIPPEPAEPERIAVPIPIPSLGSLLDILA
jgi:hypothetical protein